MLPHNEQVVHEYLMWAMCGEPRPNGKFDLYAVEGGTAAMCYIFKTLKAARLLNTGDTIALGVPIFTPYLEMPHLEDYGLNVVEIRTEREDTYQLTAADFRRLEDPKVKALFLVNPGNPTGVALDSDTVNRLAHLVSTKRPDLIILTDDVYGTFVHGFRSLLGTLPRNTIGVYSYSKYFGCTGWRLGVIALHRDNIFDEMIAAHPEHTKHALNRRYRALALNPAEIKFIDRIVADSRDVALNHTAGLSLPQQVMMTMFSLCEMMDVAKEYQKTCMEIVHHRFALAVESLRLDIKPWPTYDAYYGLFDLEYWLKNNVSPEVLAYVRTNVHPLDIVFRLAEEHGIVMLNGGGFAAPNWSARVSFANLDDEAYANIGRAVRAVATSYVREYEAAKQAKNQTPLKVKETGQLPGS
jgi:aspartate 4-decarboxylase